MSSIREDGSHLEISLCLPLQPDVFVYYTISLVRTGKMVEGRTGRDGRRLGTEVQEERGKLKEGWKEGGGGGAREGWDEGVMRVVVQMLPGRPFCTFHVLLNLPLPLPTGVASPALQLPLCYHWL